MFEVGEKIFYPMNGAGIIEAIEEKEVLGEIRTYYIMNIPNKSMNVMIPKGKENNLGIRKIVDSTTLEDALTHFQLEETEQTLNQNQRQRNNMNKIKSGNIYESAEVIRDLFRLSKKRSLGTEDRNMLNTAQQIFISELLLVKGFDQEEAADLLNQVIKI